MWNVWHLQLQDTALAALNGVPPFPLPHNADAISAHSFCRLALSVRYLPCPRHTYGSDFFIALHSEQEIYFHQLPPFDLTPKGRADLSPKGTRRLTFSAALSTGKRLHFSTSKCPVGSRSRRLRLLPDPYAYTTPNSLRSFGIAPSPCL